MITKKCSSCGQEFSCDASLRSCTLKKEKCCTCFKCWVKHDPVLALIIFHHCSPHNREYIKYRVTKEL